MVVVVVVVVVVMVMMMIIIMIACSDLHVTNLGDDAFSLDLSTCSVCVCSQTNPQANGRRSRSRAQVARAAQRARMLSSRLPRPVQVPAAADCRRHEHHAVALQVRRGCGGRFFPGRRRKCCSCSQ